MMATQFCCLATVKVVFCEMIDIVHDAKKYHSMQDRFREAT